jgi:hypothetical protein
MTALLIYGKKIPYMTLLVNMIPYMTLKTFFSLDDSRCNFFALYDTLVYYMTYKDAITPSTLCDKNKKILLYHVEYLFMRLNCAKQQQLAHATSSSQRPGLAETQVIFFFKNKQEGCLYFVLRVEKNTLEHLQQKR